jgi:hypothetical protein
MCREKWKGTVSATTASLWFERFRKDYSLENDQKFIKYLVN